MIHVTKGRATVGLLSNNGRKNMQKKPVIGVMNKATAYRASSGLSSVLAKTSVFLAGYPGRGGMTDFAVFIIWKWCGRGDLNSHGLGPTDFKSVMSTIPSRPQKRQQRCLIKPRIWLWHQSDSLTAVVTQKKLIKIPQIFFAPLTFCRRMGLINGN